MKQITLGTTGITVPQNAFGALPIQRVSRRRDVSRSARRASGVLAAVFVATYRPSQCPPKARPSFSSLSV